MACGGQDLRTIDLSFSLMRKGRGDTFKFRPSRCTHDPVSDVFQANSIGSLFFFRSPSFRTPRRAGSKKRINVGRGEGSHVGSI